MRIAALAAALIAFGMPLVAEAATGKAAKAKPPVKKVAPVSPLVTLTAAAMQGEPEAQHQLGLAYRDGAHGAKTDLHSALTWFGLAAANGSATAAMDAAAAIEKAQGQKRDPAAIALWLYRAAVLGNESARARWTELVLSGDVSSLGGGQGVEWIAAAAIAGDPRAPLILAEAFEKGNGVAVNPDATEGWLRFAVMLHGELEAQYRLGRMLLARRGAWRMPTEEEWNVKEAERKAVPFGAILFDAKPSGPEEKISQIRPGIVEGERRLDLAARSGHAEAQYHLGMALLGGIELPMDVTTGIIWLEAAAAQGHPEATMALAAYSAQGDGLFAKDPVRAYVLYDLAASAGEDGAAAARDTIAKGLSPRQSARARQIVQGIRELQGL